MILGVVLAGGGSRRFGNDKALAELGGRTLIARAVDTLSGWCELVVVTGRETAPALTLPDWPRPHMGPVGGLAAALRLARDEGYESVLTCGVDSIGLPPGLPALLSPAPAYVASQYVIGHWPVTAWEAAEAMLLGEGRHAMQDLAAAVRARPVTLANPPANINTPEDLAALERSGRF